MARIGKMHRKYVKDQFKKMMEGDLVSDQERRAMDQKLKEASTQAQAAQQIGQQRASMAMTGGNPVLVGQAKQSAEKLGQANVDAAVKASSAANKLTAALQDQRAANVLAAGERLKQQNREDVKNAIDMGLKAVDVATSAATSIADL